MEPTAVAVMAVLSCIGMMDAIQLSGVSDPSLHKDEQLGLIKLHKHEI